MGLAQAKLDVLAARIAGLSFEPAGWLGAARAEALTRLSAMGLPAKRDEYWRYTDPAALLTALPDAAKAFNPGDEPAAFDQVDCLKIVFVDGAFDAALSDDLALEGVQIELLSRVLPTHTHWATGLYGALETRGQNPVARPLATMNTAFATEGVLIRVTGLATKPVSLIYHHISDVSDVIFHHCIKIEPGAAFTLLESGPAAARLNTVMEVEVTDNGRFNHIRLQGRDHDRRAVTHLFAQIGTAAAFKSFTMTANGRMTRNEAVIELAGADASAHLAGAAMGDGDFHQDDTVFITHTAPRCESRQVFKKVLKNGAVGVFQGKILVKAGAQKTDGYQISQALLLEGDPAFGDAQFLAKPELEIYADDVKCSHGSTSGAIDETALFYLQSRGVPLAAAQSLLVQAFLAEAIDEIEDLGIADDIRARLEGWLHRHEG